MWDSPHSQVLTPGSYQDPLFQCCFYSLYPPRTSQHILSLTPTRSWSGRHAIWLHAAPCTQHMLGSPGALLPYYWGGGGGLFSTQETCLGKAHLQKAGALTAHLGVG